MRGLVATTTICGLLLAGCAKAPAEREASKPGAGSATQPASAARPKPAGKLTINDPCPAHLHDLCGPLLLYYATNFRLPERLDQLGQLPGFGSVGPFVCPESNKPYVYNPRGVVGANIIQRAVIYDAEPSHSGYRWAIVVEEPAAGGAPLIAKVVAWSEARFPKAQPTGQ